MKVRKQLKRLETMLDAGKRERFRRRDELRKLLRSMKSKERHLAGKVELEPDARRREHLRREIALLHAQRKKGVEALKDLHD